MAVHEHICEMESGGHDLRDGVLGEKGMWNWHSKPINMKEDIGTIPYKEMLCISMIATAFEMNAPLHCNWLHW